MKTRRLAACLLTLAMLFTMAIPAFAVTRTGTTGEVLAKGKTAGDSITFSKTVTVANPDGSTATNITAPTGFDVKFEVSEGTCNVTGVTAPELGTQSTTDQKYYISGTASANGISFTLPSYSKPGTYTYEITEVDPEVQGVTKSSDTYVIEVVATNKANATATSNDIECEVALYKKNAPTAKLGGVVNTYQAGNLTVGKTVTGNNADKTDTFYIEVTLHSANQVKSTVKLGEAEIAPASWTTNTDGGYDYTTTLELQNNGSKTFTNLPAGVTYTVQELTDKVDGSEQTVHTGDTVSYGGYTYTVSGEVSTATAITAGEAKTVTVTNAAGDITVNTGVILDNAPYILMASVVVAGIVVLAVVRRRRED